MKPTHISDALNQVLRALRLKAVYPAAMSGPTPFRPSAPPDASPIHHVGAGPRTACGQAVLDVPNWSMDRAQVTCERCLRTPP